MSNKRQIPFLHWQRNADGTQTAWWKPSPRLRKLGWKNRRLGTCADRNAAIRAALEANDELAEWERAGTGTAPAAPAIVTFAQLVEAFQDSAHWKAELADATRREYASRLRGLDAWARDPHGASIPVAHIEQDMVEDLKDALLPVSRFKCAASLRVLRLLLNWAKSRRVIAHNPTEGVRIPGTDSRQQKLAWTQVQALAATAEGLGHASLALAIRVGFWSLQREGDLLQMTRFKWRTLEALDPRDRPSLADHRGDVKGFRLRQLKTGAWIDAPLPAWLHAEVEAAFDRSQWLLPDPLDPVQPMPAWRLQRQARAALDAAGLSIYQFRDLRRSGMSWLKDHGALQSDVFAISGHPVLGGKRTIADTYMPPDTPAACRAIAATLRTMSRIEAREQQS